MGGERANRSATVAPSADREIYETSTVHWGEIVPLPNWSRLNSVLCILAGRHDEEVGHDLYVWLEFFSEKQGLSKLGWPDRGLSPCPPSSLIDEDTTHQKLLKVGEFFFGPFCPRVHLKRFCKPRGCVRIRQLSVLIWLRALGKCIPDGSRVSDLGHIAPKSNTARDMYNTGPTKTLRSRVISTSRFVGSFIGPFSNDLLIQGRSSKSDREVGRSFLRSIYFAPARPRRCGYFCVAAESQAAGNAESCAGSWKCRRVIQRQAKWAGARNHDSPVFFTPHSLSPVTGQPTAHCTLSSLLHSTPHWNKYFSYRGTHRQNCDPTHAPSQPAGKFPRRNERNAFVTSAAVPNLDSAELLDKETPRAPRHPAMFALCNDKATTKTLLLSEKFDSRRNHPDVRTWETWQTLRRVLSGYCRFPHHYIPTAAPSSPRFTHIDVQDTYRPVESSATISKIR
ncbi:hypothetical protein PR048_013657 [Dryococelus australis]|uniref:Uncharacterized protein n=1 Tax=Dryococelus australis TaxID=614101 RepID=A0ABQ9HSU5_9NEOP|nr:hypothetical protein PR048_013657 [Dryococelus australis]